MCIIKEEWLIKKYKEMGEDGTTERMIIKDIDKHILDQWRDLMESGKFVALAEAIKEWHERR